MSNKLFVIVVVVIFLVLDLEVAQLVAVFAGGDDTQPIPQVVLLQVLLREVLQVPLAERHFRVHRQLHLLPFYADDVTKVVRLAVYLDTFLQVFLLQETQ